MALCLVCFFAFLKMLMSAHLEHTTATLMPTVPTQKDHSTARVIRDSLEMESRVEGSVI